jgi:glycosyltransferase involved in cell wall biosynthesis
MKKKTLIFIEDGSFSYDNRVIREANALVAGGWDVTVISPAYQGDPFRKTLNRNLRAYYYPKPNARGAAGHVIEHGISLFLGFLLTFWVWLRHGFSIIHACNPTDILWLIALPYKALGKKFIFDQHDLCPELYLSRGDGTERSFLYKVLMFLERVSYQLSDVVIATNESYKEIAVKRGGKRPEEVFVVRNGPDLNKFRVVPAMSGLKKEGEVLVGYLGNMNLQDGVEYLVHAAHEIVMRRGRKDIKFVLIGGGSHWRRLSAMSLEMGLDGHVVFTGRVPDDEMLSILCACDICVQPDPSNPLNDKSTMNKVMEYMAVEKPVVAFDLKETRISCGDAALYAKSNDAADLGGKILLLANDRPLAQEMARIGRERVKKHLSWNHSVPYLLTAYDHALRTTRSTVPAVELTPPSLGRQFGGADRESPSVGSVLRTPSSATRFGTSFRFSSIRQCRDRSLEIPSRSSDEGGMSMRDREPS